MVIKIVSQTENQNGTRKIVTTVPDTEKFYNRGLNTEKHRNRRVKTRRNF